MVLPPPGTPLGELSIDVVLDFYDGPLLFVARDELRRAYLAFAMDATAYLYVPISEDRLTAVRTGLISLRDALGAPESARIFILSADGAVRTASPQEIQPDDLPEANDFLDGAVETAFPFSEEFLSGLASRQNRHLIALEVSQPPTIKRTEPPLRFAGPFFTEFQELADAIAPDSDLGLVRLNAASFVVVVSAVDKGKLVSTEAPALATLRNILRTAIDEAAFSHTLAGLTRRQQAHVRDFFSVLSESDTGVTMFTASPGGAHDRIGVPLSSVRDSLRLLRSSKELSDERIEITGHLVVVNHLRHRYGAREATKTGRRRKPRNFTGPVDASVSIEGLPSGEGPTYRMVISREQEVAEYDPDDVRKTDRLIEIEPLSETLAIGTAVDGPSPDQPTSPSDPSQ